MRALSLTLALLALAVVAMATAGKPYYDVKQAGALFEKFIRDYNRVYKDEADRELHFNAFKNNLAIINEENRVQSTATFVINEMADYTEEEKKSIGGFKPRPS